MVRMGMAMVGAALALLASGAAHGASVKAQMAFYDKLYGKVDAAGIVWGNESTDDRGISRMDPPYFTADPERVEVMEFVRYASLAGRGAMPLTRAWRASLPPGVDVHRLPYVPLGAAAARPNWGDQWRMYQRLYFAAERLGDGDRANEVLRRMVKGNPFGFKRAARRALFARRIGVEADALERAMADPEVVWRSRMATGMNRDRVWAEGEGRSMFPAFLINGKYFLSASSVGDPGKTYRIANRLIREELERGRSHHGPTNDEAFVEWIAPREGEVYKRVRLGRSPRWAGVYSHARREVWSLDAQGEVHGVYRLMGEGTDAYWRFSHPENTPVRSHMWRVGRQYVSYADEDGRPQRYGAFLLTDWLCAPDTLWVGLPFKGREVAMAFTSDGKVEAHNDQGSLFGTWWLEAGNLNVSFGELGIESWPWQEAAAHVGFEVPERSLTPWRFAPDEEARAQKTKREKKKRDWSAGGDGR